VVSLCSAGFVYPKVWLLCYDFLVCISKLATQRLRHLESPVTFGDVTVNSKQFVATTFRSYFISCPFCFTLKCPQAKDRHLGGATTLLRFTDIIWLLCLWGVVILFGCVSLEELFKSHGVLRKTVLFCAVAVLKCCWQCMRPWFTAHVVLAFHSVDEPTQNP